MNHLIKKQPSLFSGLTELHSVLDRLFDNDMPNKMEMSQWAPRIDIKEKDNHFLIKADIPGVDPKDVEVHLDNGLLTIKGQTATENKEEKETYLRMERTSGTFYRAISLPDVTDATKITAKSKHGVLEISIPKNSKPPLHKIEVESE